MNDLNSTRSRLGSLSKTKLALVSAAAYKLLDSDLPNLLAEVEAAREVIRAVNLDEKNLSFFVHERLFYYNKLTKMQLFENSKEFTASP